MRAVGQYFQIRSRPMSDRKILPWTRFELYKVLNSFYMKYATVFLEIFEFLWGGTSKLEAVQSKIEKGIY